jgi:hypothetical protein
MIVVCPLLISLKNATPSPLVLGKVNGLAVSLVRGENHCFPSFCLYLQLWWISCGVVEYRGCGDVGDFRALLDFEAER